MKNGLSLILILVSIVAGYFYIYPMYQDIGVLQEQQQEYEETLADFAEVESRKAELIAQYNNLSDADKRNIEIAVPEEVNIPLLVLDLAGIGADHNTDVDSVDTSFTENDGGVSYVDVTITLTATYDEFNGFMQDVEDSTQILDVVEVSRAEDTEARTELGNYDVTLRAYYLPR